MSDIQKVKLDRKGDNTNVIDALSAGAMDGMHMAMAIGVSLIAIFSIVALVNGILGIFGLSLEGILSYLFAPIGYSMGLDTQNALVAGESILTIYSNQEDIDEVKQKLYDNIYVGEELVERPMIYKIIQ